MTHPTYPDAVVRTPTDREGRRAATETTYRPEWFGPISFLVADRVDHGRAVELSSAVPSPRQGAITAAVYSTDEDVLDAAEEAALDAGVHLSCNLTGGGLRQPVGGVLRLPRQRREPGRERRTHRWGVRREPVPDRAVATASIGPATGSSSGRNLAEMASRNDCPIWAGAVARALV